MNNRMARKLSPDEAEIFNGVVEDGEIPTDADAFRHSLMEKQDQPLELPLVPGAWLNRPLPGRFGAGVS
jgi:hypothetical protein